MLNKFLLRENILRSIHNFLFRCYHCDEKIEVEKGLEEPIETNDSDKLIFSVTEIFPYDDIIQKIIKNITP